MVLPKHRAPVVMANGAAALHLLPSIFVLKNYAIVVDWGMVDRAYNKNSAHTCPLCSNARIAPVKTPTVTSTLHY